MIKFEIQQELERLQCAVAVRINLNRISVSLETRSKAEVPIRHAARSLWVCYRNEETLDGTDPETRRTVRKALARAFQCASQHTQCVKFIFRQLEDFDRLVQEQNLQL